MALGRGSFCTRETKEHYCSVGATIKSNIKGQGRINSAVMRAIESGVKDGSEAILGQAVRDAPIDTSALRASGTYKVDRSGTTVKSTIGFYTPYAAVQEYGNFNHPKGGKRLYLTDAKTRHGGRVKTFIADRIRKIRSF